MEAQTSLVRSDCRIELHSVTEVYLRLSLIIHPRNAESNDPFGLYKSFEKSCASVLLLVSAYDRLQRIQYAFCGFQKLGFIRMLGFKAGIHFLNI